MEDSTSTSVSTRELRNSTQRDRDRSRLANESDTDRELRNSTWRDRDRARLANESDTDRELRNSTRRDRDRARLANESETDREQHLSTRRDRARIRRQNLNRYTYNHLTEDNIAQDGPIASIIHINNGRIPDPFTLGLRDRPCYYNCNAKLDRNHHPTHPHHHHKISLITKKLRRNLNTTSVNTSRTKILLFVGTNDAHSLDFNFLTFKYDYIHLINTIKLILPNSIILPCLKDRDFNVDFINDRILILNNVINEICIERKDCNYFFTNFILQGLSQQYYKYDGLVYICHIQA